jgi:hypothetical protein
MNTVAILVEKKGLDKPMIINQPRENWDMGTSNLTRILITLG